ncbi:Sjogren's syndrome/scleroderma autoantigen 1 family protein [Halococcus thailandensis]|uniref:Sjogrens syndrome scleroderma autoantigen 1 n=1 Tax=Halococcus thailandensis JCM 13552 TaxID=1227457 RepID=M0N5C8_9EURY|nr:Sjogren's syndrome/scleroderma autoantigen 1 family protein [Halococcus thailandensis]EMA53061.1 hypothetical protein C451_10210 [Halococcus thailandensis JCM 13552]
MSEFDKEAEREKLRERFAEEDEKRETTEQMSELLLQGATMTDTHCDRCGSPLFRYDGQTFCPTCQQSADDSGADDRTATTDANDETTAANANDEQSASEQPRTQPNPSGEQTTRTPTQQPQNPTQPAQNRQTAARTDGTIRTNEQQPDPAARPASGASDLEAAEASLSRTLHELAATAEETDDLGRTREYLAAAHEAAEALDAMRTARK